MTVSEGWTDLLLGQWYCESAGDAGTAAITDMQLYAQARDKLTASLTYAAGTEFEWFARAGIARMELYLGNFTAADAAATAVLAGALKHLKRADIGANYAGLSRGNRQRLMSSHCVSPRQQSVKLVFAGLAYRLI